MSQIQLDQLDERILQLISRNARTPRSEINAVGCYNGIGVYFRPRESRLSYLCLHGFVFKRCQRF